MELMEMCESTGQYKDQHVPDAAWPNKDDS